MPLSDAPALALQILDEAADGVLVADLSRLDSPIVYANASIERMTGYTRSEFIGKNCRFLQGTDIDQQEIRQLRDAITAGQPVAVTLRNYRKDGSMFWNEVRLAPLAGSDPSGTEKRYVVGFQRDVTERVRLDTELRKALSAAQEADVARISFFKAMDHEFRTPVGIIVGFADLLASAAKIGTLDERQLPVIEDICGAAYHLLTMVEDARSYLSVNSPKDLKREQLLLSRAVKGGVERAKSMVHDLGTNLRFADCPSVEVVADLALLQQALANVISQLARRAGSGSDIAIEVECYGERVVVDVRCSSLVIPEASLHGLSHMSGDVSLMHRGLEGVGVALVVAERIIRFHDGDLSITSEATAGTMIGLTLPRARAGLAGARG